ncbi:hypothetical protein ACQ4PT_071955 [Festuca glaucescens]
MCATTLACMGLLEALSKLADEAEDALDELHYFMIQDQLDGNQEAAADLGDGLHGHALHGHHAARHTIGNWLPYFSCPRMQDDDSVAVVTSNPHSVTQSDSGNGGGHVGKLKFDRVVMSNKIRSVIERIHNLCDPVSYLLNKIPNATTVVTTKRSPTGSTVSQDKLFGRSAIFDKTVNMLTGVTYQTETLSVLPIVGPGEHQPIDDDVLQGLHPPNNIRVLGIINPGGTAGPSWLCGDISIKKLESLHLEGVSWSTLPSFEQLSNLSKVTFRNIVGMRLFGPGVGGVTERSFTHLKEIVFEDMPELVEWVGGPSSHMFSRLESIKIKDCPFLSSFPFLECSDVFTNLCTLDIEKCPALSLFPLMPHTSTLTYVRVENDGSKLLYNGKELSINGYTRPLAFHKMDTVEVLKIRDVSHVTLSDLQELNCLRNIHFIRCDDVFSVGLADTVLLPSVQDIRMQQLQITGELFSRVLSSFPALSHLTVTVCENLTLLPVEGGGLSDLRVLQYFRATCCEKLFCQWPMGEVGGGAHAIKPFPTSLRKLDIFCDKSMQSMGLLSNLTSLTSLILRTCTKLTMDGFNPLMTVNLKELSIDNMHHDEGDSTAGNLLSMIARSKLMRAGSFQLEELYVDSISGVLTAPICSHLAATLRTLLFSNDQRMTIFTEEQEQVLQLLTSLQYLSFCDCPNLQSFPRGLRGLSSLKRLEISSCDKFRSLPPKEGFPTSLEQLAVYFCTPEAIEQARKLEEADPWFSVDIIGT